MIVFVPHLLLDTLVVPRQRIGHRATNTIGGRGIIPV
jgi:hypothetical protein